MQLLAHRDQGRAHRAPELIELTLAGVEELLDGLQVGPGTGQRAPQRLDFAGLGGLFAKPVCGRIRSGLALGGRVDFVGHVTNVSVALSGSGTSAVIH